jgi:hypothetical protein
MQFFYRFDHDEMNFNTVTNCIIGIKRYEHVCVCVCARACIYLIVLTDLLPLKVEMFGLLYSSDLKKNMTVHMAMHCGTQWHLRV